jgi:peptidoglycan/LPS O-acetylase OafA/YrhL
MPQEPGGGSIGQVIGADRRMGRFEGVGGLRAIAAGLVLAYHIGLVSDAARIPVLRPFAWQLKTGVTVFFVISGFLLYLPFARSIRTSGRRPDWRQFARRRATRILPAYWVALTVIGLAPVAAGVFSVDWWRYFGLVQIYQRSTLLGGIGVAWTLCVEVSFYAALPLFACAVAKLARRLGTRDAARIQLAIIAALALSTLVLRLALTHSLSAPIVHHGYLIATSLPGLLDWFAIGMAFAVLAAEWEVDSSRFPAVRGMVRRPGGCWILAGCCFTFAAVSQGVDLFLTQYGLLVHVVIGLAAGLLVLPAIDPVRSSAEAGGPAGSRSGGRPPFVVRLLTNRVVAWLGMISYGIYLWHVKLLEAMFGSPGGAAVHPPGLVGVFGRVTLSVAAAVALGAASWYIVERPAQRRLRRVRPRRPRPAAEAELPSTVALQGGGAGTAAR